MKVLVVGSGGREHALAKKIGESDLVKELYTAPGNAGTAMVGKNVKIGAEDIRGLRDFAQGFGIDLTVVGPENPLVAGIHDYFRDQDLRVFGPSRKAAQLEGSKTFAKGLMYKHSIPTAPFAVFPRTENGIKYGINDAMKFIEGHWEKPYKLVIKGDGLAGGKAALLPDTREEAFDAVLGLMYRREFGKAGDRIVIEHRLDGEEASYIGLTDGLTFVPFESSQDHKRIGKGGTGVNTGGMGAYSPAPVITQTHGLARTIDAHIMDKVVSAMRNEACFYTGFLYAGLMIESESALRTPSVLEFNCRGGDPETQPLMARMKSDLVPYLLACTEGGLGQMAPIEWDPRIAVSVVMASGGYPDNYEKGKLITGIKDAEKLDSVQVHLAGVKDEDGKLYTSGGRVLAVTALDKTFQKARDRAYDAVDRIDFENKYFRDDIAYQALDRK